MPISDDTLSTELQHAVQLNNKQRGELAELAFMRKAATLGFAVAKPWGDSDRYDVVIRAGKLLWRVQVKSVFSKPAARSHYRVKTYSTTNGGYTPDEIDFLVAYIFAEDTWYVFPAEFVRNRTYACVRPGSARSKFEQYRNAWNLMRPSEPEPVELAMKAASSG